MKICMIISTPFPPTEGIGYYTYNLSKKLIEKGHEVKVITRGTWSKTQRQSIDGIEVIKVPFAPIYPFYLKIHGVFVNKVLKSLESEIDIIHIHMPLSPLVKTSLPITTTIHTPMLTDFRYVKFDSIHSLFSKIFARYISYPLELKILKSSKLIMTESSTIAQELKEEYNTKLDRVMVIGNGVNEKIFYPNLKKNNEFNRYILYSGRIDKEKGIFDLLESAKIIFKDRADINFILTGQGKDFNVLNKKVRALNLEDRFILLGQVSREKLLELFQNASLFVFPSYHEGLPTALLEAMSCGIPIIATDVRGNKDLISNGKNGILIPPRNPRKIAETISILLNDEKLRENLSKNARNTIIEKYTWDIIANKILKCYETLIGERT